MLIYIVAFAYSLLFAWIGISSLNFERVKYLVAVVSGLPLFILSAFRYGIGTDYFTYVEIFEDYASKGYRAGLEPLYYLLNRFIGVVDVNYQWIFIVCSAIYILFLYFSIFRDSDSPLMSIFLIFGMIFYFSSLNLMRQHVACAILLFSLKYVRERNFALFLVFVLLATGIHYSSILFLFVYFIYNVKLTPKNAFVFVAISIVLSGILVKIISIIASNTKYAMYISDDSGFSTQTILGILVQLAIIVVASIYYKDDKKYNLYYWLQTIAIIVTILGGYIGIVSRLKWMFSLPAIILMPMLISNCKNEKTRTVISACIILGFLAYALIVVGILGSQEVIPYTSILFDR